MTTIRAFFIIKDDDILLSKRYPTIEKKVQLLSNKNFVPLHNDQKLLNIFKKEICKLNRANNLEFKSIKEISIIENDDSKIVTKVFDKLHADWFHFLISIDSNKFWPCLYFPDQEYYLFIFPFIAEIYQNDYLNSEENQYFTISNSFCFQGCISFAKCLLEYIRLESISKSEFLKMADIQNILSLAIPYGKVLENNFIQIKESLNKQKLASSSNEILINSYLSNIDSAKIPQYKLYFHDGKQEMELRLEEEIISYQFNNEKMKDFEEINGKIFCSANFQENPEITLSLEGISKEIFSSFRMINPGKIYKTESIKNDGLKLIFYPQNKNFLLCSYRLNSDFEVPIKANFQKKEISPDLIKILVNLSISKNFIKNIQNIEVEMNFKNFLQISRTNLDIPIGSVNFKDKGALKWDISGHELSAETLQFNLTGTVSLISAEESTKKEIMIEKEQAENLVNSKNESEFSLNFQKFKILLENYSLPENYIIIRFKIRNSLLSKININPDTVSIYPYKKPKIKVEKKSSATQYYIYDVLNYEFNVFETNYNEFWKI